MKLLTENEIYDISMIRGQAVCPISFAKGMEEAQKLLLESASEGWDEWWESDKDMPEILGRASERVAGITNMAQRCSILSEFWAREAWKAAKLSNAKEIATLKGVLDSYGNMEVKLDLLSDENEKLQKENKEIETLKRDLKYLLKGTEYFRPDMKDACEEIRKRHNLNKDT